MDFELDHIVWAVPDLEEGVNQIHADLALEPSRGGSHVGLGTANFILGLGHESYLEVIGPDASQPQHVGPRPFGVDPATISRLATFAVRVKDIETSSKDLRERGHDPGPWRAMQRALPDGRLLSWKLTQSPEWSGGVVPFLIEWGDAVHPSTTCTQGARLERMYAEHPDPQRVRDAWFAMGLQYEVEKGPRARLHSLVRGPAGEVVLAG